MTLGKVTVSSESALLNGEVEVLSPTQIKVYTAGLGIVAGPQGPPGEGSATVSIADTFSVAAGTPALVENIGTETAAVLNFYIPIGEQGAQGIQGIQGEQGIQGIQGIPGPVQKIIAGTNVTISPTDGLGEVTINASGGGGGDLTAGPIRSVSGTSSINSQTGTGETFVMSTGSPTFASEITVDNGIVITKGANKSLFGNIAIGTGNLNSNSTGQQNLAIGSRALEGTQTGQNNIAIGADSMRFGTNPNDNLALGAFTLMNSNGVANTALGSGALFGLTTGNGNLAVGTNAMSNATNASNQIAVGTNALQNVTSGENNTAIGFETLKSTGVGSNNTALGALALQNNTNGSDNTAIGLFALNSNSTGGSNTAIGVSSQQQNNGSFNVSTGTSSLSSNTSGNANIAYGANALQQNTVGNFNQAFGNSALAHSRTGSLSSGFGSSALIGMVDGAQNTAIGTTALRNSTGRLNSFGAITGGSGYPDGTYNNVQLNPNHQVPPGISLSQVTANITVSGGSVVGLTVVEPGFGIRTDTVFTANPGAIGGSGEGFSVVAGSTVNGNNNVALGNNAGRNNYTGSRNVFLGHSAGMNETGDDKLYISNTSTSAPLIQGRFDPAGGYTGEVIINGAFGVRSAAPTASNSPGFAGQFAGDANYFYLCIAPNTWKRAPISTW